MATLSNTSVGSLGAKSSAVNGSPSREITVLLGQHYGDGTVYLHSARDRILLREAISKGFVSPEGYLTPQGHQVWLRMAQ